MGRVIKRVPQSFIWPLNMPWKGYISPYRSQECKPCKGSGYSEFGKEISDSWYGHLRTDGLEGWGHNITQDEVQALLDADRLWDFTRVALNEQHKRDIEEKMHKGGNSWLPYNNGYIPTADEVNAWSRKGMGHDSINQGICVRQRVKRLGGELLCSFCSGDGEIWFSEEAKQRADNWYEKEKYEPPTGKGWQLWETVSEGSPISPVFNTPEALAHWCVDNPWGADSGTSYEQWLKFIKGPGWAPSGILSDKGYQTGVQAA